MTANKNPAAVARAQRVETAEFKALEDRFRRPIRWALAHPLRAVRRIVRNVKRYDS